MKVFNIEITNEAINDLEKIYLYIANSLLSPEIASGQYERITQSILFVSKNTRFMWRPSYC
jgi:hypothetical protein